MFSSQIIETCKSHSITFPINTGWNNNSSATANNTTACLYSAQRDCVHAHVKDDPPHKRAPHIASDWLLVTQCFGIRKARLRILQHEPHNKVVNVEVCWLTACSRKESWFSVPFMSGSISLYTVCVNHLCTMYRKSEIINLVVDQIQLSAKMKSEEHLWFHRSNTAHPWSANPVSSVPSVLMKLLWETREEMKSKDANFPTNLIEWFPLSMKFTLWRHSCSSFHSQTTSCTRFKARFKGKSSEPKQAY